MTLATNQGFSSRRAQAPFLQGWLLVEEGHEQAGITEMAKSLAGDRARGVSGRWTVHYVTLLADAYRKSGQTVAGLRVVTEELDRVHINGERSYHVEVHRVKGELLLTQDTPDEQQAEACFQNALKVARGDELEPVVAETGQEGGGQAIAGGNIRLVHGGFRHG